MSGQRASARAHLAADGTRLAVHETGAGAATVFQHGLCGDARQPYELFPHRAGRRLVTLECRAHGESATGPEDAFSIARFADDLAGFMDAERLGRAVVGGVSMGAAVALRLAVRRPDLVRALVLVRPAWVADAAPANMRPNAEAGRLLAHHPPGRARALFEASGTAARLAADAPDNLASLRGLFSREPAAVTAALLRAIAADGPGLTEGEVAAVRVPALVVGCGRDVVHPLATAERLAALLPHPRLVRVTPKGDDRRRHVGEVCAALDAFLLEVAL
ncbi:alpha/beta hydrolase [Gemmatimonadetes bacterium T265]|nr:alpha/beta hydrolase [Gemmatimonadetes bacterium T265]